MSTPEMEAWIQNALDASYWRELAPQLTVEGPPAPAAPPLAEAERTDLRSWILAEGYHASPPMVTAERTAALVEAVRRLDDEGLPATFLFAYDEPWTLGAWYGPWIEAVLGPGFRMLPYFWAWNVDGGAADGWGPHRDDTNFEAVLDGSWPRKLTIWVALTDATPLTSCIYVVPVHRDQAYMARDAKRPPPRLEDVRALPATAGTVLSWSTALLHWGSMRSPRAQGPRISYSIEYQRGDTPAFREPLLDPGALPPLRHRLGLIGRQLVQYQHMAPLDDDLGAMANELAQRFG